MKILMTSAGITNKSLEEALKKLVEGKIKIAFIPTAANMEEGDKKWLINNFDECAKLGEIDIVDISALPKKEWLSRLEQSNVIVVGGGWTTYLMDQIKKSGLDKELPNLLKTRVYVGISAGSIILSKTLFASSEFIYGDEDQKKHEGLGYVNFNFRPHLNSVFFPKVNDENLKKIAPKLDQELYAMDDQSGILWEDGKMKIISEGKWKLYKK